MKFKILHNDKKSKARVGEITTPHGVVQTPTFTPVGTQATVKSLSPDDLKSCGAQLIFGNTYHLHLRPGEEVVRDFGGLSKFMSWEGSTITDSGGFQVFSLGQKKIVLFDQKIESLPAGEITRHSGNPPAGGASRIVSTDDRSWTSPSTLSSGQPKCQDDKKNEEETQLVKITQDGVKFRSHLDGSQHMFTPEVSIKIQKKLGADLILAFDECAPHPSTHEYTKEATQRTHNWAERCVKAFKDKKTTFFKQGLYGIVQGGVYEDLRTESAKFIGNLDTFGLAIGGVSVGESKQEMRNALLWTTPFLPEEKPKHLLGIGEVDDIFAAVEYGMDTFDCVIPTRFGRYGIVFISPEEGGTPVNKFRLDLAKTAYARDQGPVTNNCDCQVCKTFKRGYIHHLLKANEMLGYRLASYHNVYFLLNLSRKIRESLLEDRFQQLKKEWIG